MPSGFLFAWAVSEERFKHGVLDVLIWRESFCNCFLRNPNERNVHVGFEARRVKGRDNENQQFSQEDFIRLFWEKWPKALLEKQLGQCRPRPK
jgi:hypothetical protein